MNESEKPSYQPLLTSLEVRHERDGAEVFRDLLPFRHQGPATIYGATAIVHTYSSYAHVRVRFTSVTAAGKPFRGTKDQGFDVHDDWLPICFPDPVARNFANRLLEERRDSIRSSTSPVASVPRSTLDGSDGDAQQIIEQADGHDQDKSTR